MDLVLERLEYKRKKTLKFHAILAQSLNGAIGLHGSLPWHEPQDLKFFMRTTMGKYLLMGRGTWESFKEPLPKRQSIVLTSKTNLDLPESVHQAPNLTTAMELIPQGEEVFIIGGKRVYEDTLELVDLVWVTLIKLVCKGDVYFNIFNHMQPKEWGIVEQRILSDRAELFVFEKKYRT